MIMLDDARPVADHDQDDRALTRARAQVARLERLLVDQVAFGSSSIADLVPIIDESRETLRLMLERHEQIARLQRRVQIARELTQQ
jgi:hypothetical protein